MCFLFLFQKYKYEKYTSHSLYITHTNRAYVNEKSGIYNNFTTDYRTVIMHIHVYIQEINRKHNDVH